MARMVKRQAKSKQPQMTILLQRGERPPEFCPRCLSSPVHKKNGWRPVTEGLKEYYLERGYYALAECVGCMWVLIQPVNEEADGA